MFLYQTDVVYRFGMILISLGCISNEHYKSENSYNRRLFNK